MLLNGSSGVAVGMSTNIPPHNIVEVIDASIALIKNPEISHEEFFSIVKGPDFPTGGIVTNGSELSEIYRNGEGTIYLRSKVELDENLITITEIPYKVNKASLIEEIDSLIKRKKVDGLKSVTDYSN